MRTHEEMMRDMGYGGRTRRSGTGTKAVTAVSTFVLALVLGFLMLFLTIWLRAWFVMIAVGILHHEISSKIPAIGYWPTSFFVAIALYLLFGIHRSGQNDA